MQIEAVPTLHPSPHVSSNFVEIIRAISRRLSPDRLGMFRGPLSLCSEVLRVPSRVSSDLSPPSACGSSCEIGIPLAPATHVSVPLSLIFGPPSVGHGLLSIGMTLSPATAGSGKFAPIFTRPALLWRLALSLHVQDIT